MKTISGLTLAPGADERGLYALAAKKLGVRPGAIEELQIKRRSLDARRKGAIKYVYTVDVRLQGEPPVPADSYEIPRLTPRSAPPLISARTRFVSIMSSIISRARLARYSPSGVKLTPLLLRSTTLMPNSFSIRWSCFVSVGWLTYIESAAFVRLRYSWRAIMVRQSSSRIMYAHLSAFVFYHFKTFFPF